MRKILRNIRTQLTWIRKQILFEPLNKGRKLHYLGNYFIWHLFYKYFNRRWIITFENGLKSIVYPYPDHDAGEINIWTRNVDWHDHEFIRTVLKKGDCMLDLGCNVGNRTLALADLAGKAVLVDAGETAVRRTRENIALNHLSPDDFVVIRKAMGEKPGKVYFTNLGGASTLNKVISEAEKHLYKDVVEVELITVDQLVQEMRLSPVFIKIDVEGQDLQVLRGAMKTLASGTVKLITFEHNQSEALEPFLEFFKSIGWEVFALDKEGRISQAPELIWRNMNLFASPASFFREELLKRV